MKKNVLALICFSAFVIIISFSAAGYYSCGRDEYSGFTNLVENYDVQIVAMDTPDSYKFDIKEIFKGSGISITKYKLFAANKDILTVSGNKITAKGAGKTRVECVLYSKAKKMQYYTTLAEIYISDAQNMTKINTVDDLINISQNLSGNYILNSNLDLSVVDNWEAIGLVHDEFKGSFVNPHGYKISNLTTRFAEKEEYTDGPYKAGDAGLFGWAKGCYIDGIILDNVLIFNENNALLPETSGGIVSTVFGGLINNCSVSGKIYGKYYYAGGIVGCNEAYVFNCTFNGEVAVIEPINRQSGAGGIAGWSAAGNYFGGIAAGIKNCVVTADIYSNLTAGGIVGFNHRGLIEDCVYNGELHGIYKGDMFGADRFTE